MKKTLMNLQKMYFDSQDKVREFKRDWDDVRFTNGRKRHDINVTAALIYLYKHYDMDFGLLDNFLSSGKINNPEFQNTMKAYIYEKYIQKFVSEKAYLDDDFLLGVAFFYDEQKLYREDGAREDNESLNILLVELLDSHNLENFSFLQGNANPGRILLDVVSKTSLLNYTAYAINPDLMVVLQLRILLLQTIQQNIELSGIIQPKELFENQLFDRILTMPLWRPLSNTMEDFPERTSLSRLEVPESKIADGEWHEILFNFSLLDRNGKMVTLITNSTLANNLSVKTRQALVEKGYIESIIELPDRLLENTGIELYAVVLSYGNKGIKFLDASQAYTEQRRRKDIDVTTVLENLDNPEVCRFENIESIAREGYNLLPKRYTLKTNIVDGIPLGEICNISRGLVISSKELDDFVTDVDTGVRYLYTKDADGDAVDYSQSPFIDVEKLKRKFTLLDNDTWLLGRTSPFRSNMLYVEGNDKLIANGNQFSITILPKYKNQYLLPYLALYFNSKAGREQIERFAVGQLIKSLSLKDLKTLKIPKVSIEKQQEVVNRIRMIETEIKAVKEQLKILNRQKELIVEEEFNW
ncbi:MAG: N-6 DNA methylase [Veillonella sp.]